MLEPDKVLAWCHLDGAIEVALIAGGIGSCVAVDKVSGKQQPCVAESWVVFVESLKGEFSEFALGHAETHPQVGNARGSLGAGDGSGNTIKLAHFEWIVEAGVEGELAFLYNGRIVGDGHDLARDAHEQTAVVGTSVVVDQGIGLNLVGRLWSGQLEGDISIGESGNRSARVAGDVSSGVALYLHGEVDITLTDVNEGDGVFHGFGVGEVLTQVEGLVETNQVAAFLRQADNHLAIRLEQAIRLTAGCVFRNTNCLVGGEFLEVAFHMEHEIVFGNHCAVVGNFSAGQDTCIVVVDHTTYRSLLYSRGGGDGNGLRSLVVRTAEIVVEARRVVGGIEEVEEIGERHLVAIACDADVVGEDVTTVEYEGVIPCGALGSNEILHFLTIAISTHQLACGSSLLGGPCTL